MISFFILSSAAGRLANMFWIMLLEIMVGIEGLELPDFSLG